jgi:hypothetical protein
VRWSLDEGAHFSIPLGTSTLRFNHPDLGLVSIGIGVNSTSGEGYVDTADFGAETMESAEVHWLNIPESASGSIEIDGAGWRTVFEERPGLGALYSAAKRRPQHVVSHSASIKRADGSSFTADELTTYLTGLQMALSFASGRWVAPMLVAGFDRNRLVHEQWRMWRCDLPETSAAWWDPHRAHDLRELVRLYLGAWYDEDKQDRVRYYTHHVIEAGRESALEARVLLLGAANEYLWWVRQPGTRSEVKERRHALGASNVIRELLDFAGVPRTPPPELHGIGALIAGHTAPDSDVTDGPGAIVWVRNRIAHPKDANQPYRINSLMWNTWILALQYSELILLHELGYKSRYRPRVPPNRWAHSSELVPWASP